MPFKSQQQKKWMYANDPEMAAKWEAHTPKGKKLPKYTPKKKKKKTKSDYHTQVRKIANIEEALGKKIKAEHPEWTFDEIVAEIDRLGEEFLEKQEKKSSYGMQIAKRAMRDGGWQRLPISVMTEKDNNSPDWNPMQNRTNMEPVFIGYIRGEKVVSIGHYTHRNYIKVSDIIAGKHPQDFSFSSGTGGKMKVTPHAMQRVYSFVLGMGPDD